ncbi:MAG: hypothetical protein H8E64_00680, partial [Candidatus Marinimicrobia bacterium]|nr:hypothetical protein [Candidatus Neomarinimicrobiota bacterium]
MNKSVIATIFALITTFVFSETMVINTNEFSVQVLNSNDQQTTISYDFGSYNRFPVEINGETYYRLHVENEAVTFDSAAPELPKITRSIIISDDAKVKVNVIEYEYTEYQFPIVPSKGLILRTQNPDEVPYTFGDIYQQDTEYPINIGELGTPYILRDFRGVSVTAYPFIYNPQTQTLRVYYHLILEVNTIGKDVVNVKTRITNSYDKYFEGLYSGHFINFDEMRYDTIDEHGRMIVIAYVAFMEAMQPFVDWKNQKGIPCDM